MILKRFRRYVRNENTGRYTIVWREFANIDEAVEIEKPFEEYYKVIKLGFDASVRRKKVLENRRKAREKEIRDRDLLELERIELAYKEFSEENEARKLRDIAEGFATTISELKQRLDMFEGRLSAATVTLDAYEKEFQDAKQLIKDALEAGDIEARDEARLVRNAARNKRNEQQRMITEVVTLVDGALILYNDAVSASKEAFIAADKADLEIVISKLGLKEAKAVVAVKTVPFDEAVEVVAAKRKIKDEATDVVDDTKKVHADLVTRLDELNEDLQTTTDQNEIAQIKNDIRVINSQINSASVEVTSAEEILAAATKEWNKAKNARKAARIPLDEAKLVVTNLEAEIANMWKEFEESVVDNQ